MALISTEHEIIWRVHFRSARRAVYRLLSTDDGRSSFWAEAAVERDGAIHFRFINGVSTVARILRMEEPGLFEIEYFGSTARFELSDDGDGGTDLTLTNTGVPDGEREEVLTGWLNVLFPLKATADFGVDLRNHDAARTWERGFIDQ